MKKIRCPKCDNYILFDDTKYEEGQSLVFVCDNCKKQFSIRIKKIIGSGSDTNPTSPSNEFGKLVIIENAFGYKQVFPLHEGDNIIGRRNRGTEVDIPIETNDPSMDRRHCIINVKKQKDGEIAFTLRDNDSITGTFLMNDLLGPKDRIRIEDGSVITIGATTLILQKAGEQ